MNKDLCFEYIEDFADYIIDRVENDEDLFLEVVGKFETIKPLLKEVMAYECVNFESIEAESAIVNNYADEFVLSLWADSGVVEIGCEKMKRNGEYISLCSDETYLLEDCSSKIIPLCEDSDLYFVNTEDDCLCDEECDECCPCACHNDDICEECDDIHGFAVSKEGNGKHYDFYYYTSDTLREKDICSILKEFGF